jgi:amino acid transporter
MDSQNNSLFDLSITPESRSHLSEAAKWAKFLAICGLIGLILIVIAGLYMSFTLSRTMGAFESEFRREGVGYSSTGLGITTAVTYILMALLYFFPLLFLLHFSNKMKAALAANDTGMLSESFRNLKKTFRYLGVLTIIGLVFFALALLLGGLAALSM